METRGLPSRKKIQVGVACRKEHPIVPDTIKHSDRIAWKDERERLGVQEVLWITKEKNLLEFSNGNVFVYRQDRVYTPLLNGRLLSGIMRSAVLLLSEEKGVPIEERELCLQNGDELYFSSSLRGLIPVTLDANSHENRLKTVSDALWSRLSERSFQSRVNRHFISQNWK